MSSLNLQDECTQLHNNLTLPMSLVPKESLLAILDFVGDEIVLSGSGLSLAIPATLDLLSYYDATLLKDVTVPKRLILTLSIPLASRQTVF